jgi:hypothetical protein
LTNDPKGPSGVDDDPLSVFGREGPSSAPSVPAAAASRGAAKSPAWLYVTTRAAGVMIAMSIVIGVVIGVSFTQMRRALAPSTKTPPAATGGRATDTPQAQIANTRDRRDTAPVPAPPSHTTARTASPEVSGRARADERPNPRDAALDSRRTGRASEGSAASVRTGATADDAAPSPVAPEISLQPLSSIPVAPERIAYVPIISPAPPPAAARRDDEMIQSVIDAYRAHCERLDAASAATLWRGVDSRALSRAFSTLSSQTLTFDRCDIDVAGARGTAVCKGSLSYVRRFGDQTPQSRQLSWAFEFERDADRWMISSVTAR